MALHVPNDVFGYQRVGAAAADARTAVGSDALNLDALIAVVLILQILFARKQIAIGSGRLPHGIFCLRKPGSSLRRVE